MGRLPVTAAKRQDAIKALKSGTGFDKKRVKNKHAKVIAHFHALKKDGKDSDKVTIFITCS
jgi:hypothetical protein